MVSEVTEEERWFAAHGPHGLDEPRTVILGASQTPGALDTLYRAPGPVTDRPSPWPASALLDVIRASG